MILLEKRPAVERIKVAVDCTLERAFCIRGTRITLLGLKKNDFPNPSSMLRAF